MTSEPNALYDTCSGRDLRVEAELARTNPPAADRPPVNTGPARSTTDAP